MHRRITSPSEPVFGLMSHSVSLDLLDEWIEILIDENNKRIEKASPIKGYFISQEISEFVFNTCDRLKVAQEARYLALELFDRFMIQHVYYLYGHVQKTGEDHKLTDWLAILERVKKQLVLRAVTCVQVASKLTSHYKIVTPKKAWHILSELGHKYNTSSILQSEIRVAKTLGFEVMLTTPLTYIETLLSTLGQKDESLPVKDYYNSSVNVLDLVYMNRKPIYDSLFMVVNGYPKKTKEDVEKFVKVENDTLLLSVAVIAASVYMIDQSTTDRVIENLTSVVHIQSNDIIDFTTVIIKLLTQSPEH